MRTFNLFIGRFRAYFNAYRYLLRPPDKRPHFRFSTRERSDKYDRKRLRNVTPVPATVYSGCDDWTGKEIEIAKRRFSAEKPIVATRPRGSGRISTLVGNDAGLIVGRNAGSVVSARRRLA